MSEYTEKLGERIRRRMSRLQITAENLSHEVGVSAPTLSRIITGSNESTNWKLLELIAERLGWTLPVLLDTRERSVFMTGIKHLDNAILKWNIWLFRGDEGYKKLQQMVDPDYELVYADAPAFSEERHGPNLLEEMAANYNPNREIESTVRSANLLSDNMVLSHTRISRLLPRGDQAKNILDTPLEMIVSDMIDVWELSIKASEIKKGQPYVIIRRYVQSIGRQTTAR